MARMTFYTPGRKPQYGRARWGRYESLRVSGFTKAEARGLSKARAEQPLDVIRTMAKQREKLLDRFSKLAVESGWAGRGAYNRFAALVRQWYEKNNLTSKQGRATPASKGGRPDLWVYYHRVENQKARGKGWKKGEFDRRREAGEPDTGRPTRRPKRDTPLKKAKGLVKDQKKRARARAKSFRDLAQGEDTPTTRKQKRAWIEGLRKTARNEPERDAQLTKQARRLGFTGRSLLPTRGRGTRG